MMNRRTFFALASVEFVIFASWGAEGSPRRPVHVHTVLGPISPRKLGRTLMHEHVLVDFIGADKIAPGRYDSEEAFRVSLPRLRKLKSVGCDTLVECTPNFIGRNPELLRRLSKASGLNIITNTGLYGAAEDKFVPSFAYEESADQLAARWVMEFEEGIPPTGIRPGFIKIGVDAGPLSEIDAKLVRAAARTHRRTGLAFAAHTGDGIAAMAELDVLEEEGVAASAFIWVHAQSERNPTLHLRAAERGAWVEFDGISPETLDQHVELVVRTKRAGHLNRVLISQDAGWYHVGEPAGGSYRGYDFLFMHFLPALRKAGATDDDIQTLLVRNPREALTPRS